ncbi:MAG: class IV adenylate cyclase [Planctomycetota bacterium]|jgi:adenylate cyclase class 2
MCVEIEAKLKVDSHNRIVEKLTELGAEFLAEHLQKDWHFDDANSRLAKTDSCLRLRRQLTGRQERIFLTYKGLKEKNRFKRRKEIELEVKDGDSMQKLLLALGYEKTLSIEKKRRLWRLGDCEVALDTLPLLGSFVEIEGPDEETIANVQKDLGLSDLPHIQKSYAALMRNKLRQQN